MSRLIEALTETGDSLYVRIRPSKTTSLYEVWIEDDATGCPYFFENVTLASLDSMIGEALMYIEDYKRRVKIVAAAVERANK